MNDLIVKNVDVFGDSVLAAKDENGIIWVGLIGEYAKIL